MQKSFRGVPEGTINLKAHMELGQCSDKRARTHVHTHKRAFISIYMLYRYYYILYDIWFALDEMSFPDQQCHLLDKSGITETLKN